MSVLKTTKGNGTAIVFIITVTCLLGSLVFLRFGYAVGMLGFTGAVGLILLCHLVTVPTALSLSELATNQKVEGGDEYFIISRSFGLNIGATIGVALYVAQAISIAFFVVIFTEALAPLLDILARLLEFIFKPENAAAWARRLVGVPFMYFLSFLVLKKGLKLGPKVFFLIGAVLAVSLFAFFMGRTEYSNEYPSDLFSIQTGNIKTSFFVVLALIFPAFTAITAGFGFSGSLKSPGLSIASGTILATLFALPIYIFIAYKLALSASPDDLVGDALIMGKIAKFGSFLIPIGIAVSAFSCAMLYLRTAPRTLQALASDGSIPIKGLNKSMAICYGKAQKPRNATLFTCVIAMVFVFIGGIDKMAGLITILFIVAYGSICLISFLYHFGADPSYRPVFRSRWYVSLAGFLTCTLLFINMKVSISLPVAVFLFIIYKLVNKTHKERGGMTLIFQAAVFQLSRNIQVYMQRRKNENSPMPWRPSVICISKHTFTNKKVLSLLAWVSDKYGFGTYLHFIEDNFSGETKEKADGVLEKLIEIYGKKNRIYLNTLISPSYASAIAQIVQLPGVSGMGNNMVLFEYEKEKKDQLYQISENFALARAANMDVCIFATSQRKIAFYEGIHVWLRSNDLANSKLMVLLSYIISGHKDWGNGKLKIFEIATNETKGLGSKNLVDIINSGRLPISPGNIEIIEAERTMDIKIIINDRSKLAGLCVIGFLEEQLQQDNRFFSGLEDLGDVLFVNARELREIN